VVGKDVWETPHQPLLTLRSVPVPDMREKLTFALLVSLCIYGETPRCCHVFILLSSRFPRISSTYRFIAASPFDLRAL
jgi:hypothetical protein